MSDEHARATSAIYRIVGNFRGRKLSQICNFPGENFHGLFSFAMPKDTIPPQILRRNFQINTRKTATFAEFSPSKVSRYTVVLSLDEYIGRLVYTSKLPGVLQYIATSSEWLQSLTP